MGCTGHACNLGQTVWLMAHMHFGGQDHVHLRRVQNLQEAGLSPEVPGQEGLVDSSAQNRCLSTPPINTGQQIAYKQLY